MSRRRARPFAFLAALGAAQGVAEPAGAWSLSRELVRPALAAAARKVRRCGREHAAPDGRYLVWIVVDARGRGRAALRDFPIGASAEARRCIAAAYSAGRYPTAAEATVAWTAASPPRSSYSIGLPLELRLHAYAWLEPAAPNAASPPRPRPVRSREIARR